MAISVMCHISLCWLPVLFHGNSQNYQLRELHEICDIAATMPRQRIGSSFPPSQSSRPTFILVLGLDPTLNSYISCSVLTKSTLNSIQTY